MKASYLINIINNIYEDDTDQDNYFEIKKDNLVI